MKFFILMKNKTTKERKEEKLYKILMQFGNDVISDKQAVDRIMKMQAQARREAVEEMIKQVELYGITVTVNETYFPAIKEEMWEKLKDKLLKEDENSNTK